MTVIAFVPPLLMIAGAIVYLLPVKAEVKEMSRIAFFVGLLVLTLGLSGHVVRLGAGL